MSRVQSTAVTSVGKILMRHLELQHAQQRFGGIFGVNIGDQQPVVVADFVEQQLGRLGVAEVAEHVDVRIFANQGRQDRGGGFALGGVVRRDFDVFHFALAMMDLFDRRRNRGATDRFP